jgi:hypothetical protein
MKFILSSIILGVALLAGAGCDPTPCDPDQVYVDGLCYYPSPDGGGCSADGGACDGG